MVDDLETPPEGVNKLDKKVSAKIRLLNKRNAVKVVKKLLDSSKDETGMLAFSSDPNKQDDMADAILLACGTAFAIQKQREKLDRMAKKLKKGELHKKK